MQKLKKKNPHFWKTEFNIYLMNSSHLVKIKIIRENKIRLNGFRTLSTNLYLEEIVT